jgi:hypothetical protein
LLKKAIETNIDKAERTVRCTCLLHNIIFDIEGKTHDPFVQETLRIHGSRHANTNVTCRSFSWTSKGAMDIRNAFKEWTC